MTSTNSKKILVAVDATPMAEVVIAAAVDLARAVGGRLRLLHAVPMAMEVPPPGSFLIQPSNQVDVLVNNARGLITNLIGLVPPELRDTDRQGDGIVEIGAPTDVILNVARSYDADFVVIGAHQHNAIARALGTVAARVANRLERPLLVVRPKAAVTASATKENPAPIAMPHIASAT